MVFDRNIKLAFGKVSTDYERFREDYPIQIYKEIKKFAKLKPKNKVLEIGCGTGKATMPFVKSGLSVLCLDVNKELIREAMKKTSKFKNVDYKLTSFENAKLNKSSFDLIFAAQAWHWVDPDIGYKKLIRILKKGGAFAIFSKIQNNKKSDLGRGAEKLYKKYCPKYPGNIHKKEEAIKSISQIGSFGKMYAKEFNINKKFNKTNFLGLTGTYSWVADLDERNRKMLLHELSKLLYKQGKDIFIPYRYNLLMWKKIR